MHFMKHSSTFCKKIVKCCWNVCGWLRKNRCSWLNEIWMASFNIKDCFLLPCIQSSYIPTIAFLSKKTGNSSAERNLLHWTFILWLGSFNYLEIWLFINVIIRGIHLDIILNIRASHIISVDNSLMLLPCKGFGFYTLYKLEGDLLRKSLPGVLFFIFFPVKSIHFIKETLSH